MAASEDDEVGVSVRARSASPVTDGLRVIRYDVRSLLVRRSLQQLLVVPGSGRRPCTCSCVGVARRQTSW